MTAEPIHCPNCSTELSQGTDASEAVTCSHCQFVFLVAASTVNPDPVAEAESDSEPEKEPESDQAQPEPKQPIIVDVDEARERRAKLSALLPPKFLIADPDFEGGGSETVMIPDGKGGIASVKRNVVKVQHKGKTVELITLTPEERRRRQAFWNCIWVIAGVLFFWLVFSMI